MKIIMTAISKRQHACSYIKKSEKTAKRYIYKIPTLCKKQDNFRYVV